jgi:DNA-binding transcriptional LysR family regulator
MEWSDIRIFLAIARSGSLGGAARTLQISHPTVGRRLRVLEEATGQTLFQRNNDGMLLTDAGKQVLGFAEDMEAHALAMERRLAGDSDRLEGVLRISSAEWFASYVLPPVLESLLIEYPSIVPELIADMRLVDLSRREADIAFRVVPFQGPDIVQRRLMDVQYGLYAGPGVQAPVSGDGEGSRLLLMDTAQLYYPDVLWARQMLPRARTVLSSNSRELQARMCARGLGLAVLPRPVGDHYPDLRLVDLGEAPPNRTIWMGYHQDLRRMDRLRAMADLAARLLGEHSPASPRQN